MRANQRQDSVVILERARLWTMSAHILATLAKALLGTASFLAGSGSDRIEASC